MLVLERLEIVLSLPSSSKSFKENYELNTICQTQGKSRGKCTLFSYTPIILAEIPPAIFVDLRMRLRLTATLTLIKGRTIRKVMGRVGKNRKKIHANKKGLKKIHASDLFKMREDIFKKNIHTQPTFT